VARSIRIGGDEMDVDIVAFARREYNLLMGERTAEEIKIAVGSAYPQETDRTVTFRGRDLLTGLPRSVVVGSVMVGCVVVTVGTTGGSGTGGGASRCLRLNARFSSDCAVSGSAARKDAASFASISPAAVTTRICGAAQETGFDEAAAAVPTRASAGTSATTRRRRSIVS